MNKPLKLLLLFSVYSILGYIGYISYENFVVKEYVKQEEAQKEKEKQLVLNSTGSNSIYKDTIDFSLDTFSAYYIFRSEEFRNQFGVFPIDALIKLSAKYKKLPVSIIALCDETRGADGLVAYKEAFPNVDSLNDPETKFVLVKNSPSETLVKVLLANFNLDRISNDPFVYVPNISEVYNLYKTSPPAAKRVFVLWQPFISKVLENPNTHIVIDSSKFQGYIVDAIVCNRDVLYKNPELANDLITSYYYAFNNLNKNVSKNIIADAKKLGELVTEKQAESIVKGIWWKNIQENYSHFGNVPGSKLQHVQSIIENITNILIKSKTIENDPLAQSHNLFFDKILSDLYHNSFYPNAIPDVVEKHEELKELTEKQWTELLPVGTIEVEQLVFLRGTSSLTERSNVILDSLIKTLNTFPQYYLIVQGNAGTLGDLTANKLLAGARAQKAADYLMSKGINKNRLKVVSGEPTGTTSVRFIFGQSNE
jgi:flagellar motor protein MotB